MGVVNFHTPYFSLLLLLVLAFLLEHNVENFEPGKKVDPRKKILTHPTHVKIMTHIKY